MPEGIQAEQGIDAETGDAIPLVGMGLLLGTAGLARMDGLQSQWNLRDSDSSINRTDDERRADAVVSSGTIANRQPASPLVALLERSINLATGVVDMS